MDIWFSNENVWQASGDPAAGGSPAATITQDEDIFMASLLDSNSSNVGGVFNFGATAFDGTIPNGFTTLATQNLSTPAVINYEDEYYIQAGISHSNGSTTAVTLPKTVSGGAMVRIKRTNTTGGWYVFDTVRGANKFSYWDLYATEDTSTFDDQNLTGTTFTIPSDMASGTYLIEVFYVGVYFQIDLYNGNSATRTLTYDTALDTAPGMMVFFRRSGTSGSLNVAYHSGIGATHNLATDTAGAQSTISTVFNNTEPTTSGYTLGNNEHNKTGGVYVSYHWANSGPYSWGLYEGSNNSDGPMITESGLPNTALFKNIDATANWAFKSTALSPSNVADDLLLLSTTSTLLTGSQYYSDLVSNGVKHRNTNASMNAANTYIYGFFGIQPMTDGSVNQGRAR
tara:strand:- start:249 stop:1442 length:1194 start_codon:yes stop_codon:yes gene_type:complete